MAALSTTPVSADPQSPRWHIALLVLLPILVHAPELSGVVSSDPNRLFFGLSDPVRDWTEGGLIPGMPGWIDGCAGVIVEALGRLVARDWLHGIVPWWNPYNGVGMPLAGEYQPAAFFLPFILLTALPNGLLWMKLSLQLVAGLSTRALFREMGLHPAVALAGGIAWTFNGSFAWASDGPVEPIAFLPMALLGIERLRGGRGGGWGWLALGIGWMLLAGFPETTFLLGLLALGWAALRLGQERKRGRFAFGVGCGGVAALLLAAPQLLAFVSYMPHAFVGGHVGANDTPLPHEAWIMQLFPYVNGPIFYGAQTVWWSMGGFYGVLPVWLAILSLLLPGRRGLRLFLGAVVAVVVCKQAAVPGVTWLVDLVPGMRNIFFFRYSPPVGAFALLVLAALALDDLIRERPDGARRGAILVRGGLSAVIVLLAAWIAWALDRPLQQQLRGVSHGPVSSAQYAFGSLAVGVCLLGLALVFLNRKRGGVPALLVLVAVEPVLLFSVPLLSTMQPPRADKPLLAALRAQIGSNRLVTIGPMPPNVNASYGLRAINHNGVPMPAAWIDRLKRDFGSRVDTLSFNGFSPFDAAGRPFLADALATTPERFGALGVGLVLTPHGFRFGGRRQDGLTDIGAGGEVLEPGATLTVDGSHWPSMTVRRAALTVGTFVGRSDGTLVVLACPAGGACVEGRGAVAGTPDNGALPVVFDRPFDVTAGETLRLSFRLDGARGPLMVWFRAAPWGRAPAMELQAARMPQPVASTPHGDLFALPGAAAYFQADGCRLDQRDLRTVVADCLAPATLIRRELMMPGWRATLHGATVTPATWDGLFQSLPLPAGRSRVEFSFAPPGAPFAWAGAALGVLLAAAGFRRRDNGRVPRD